MRVCCRVCCRACYRACYRACMGQMTRRAPDDLLERVRHAAGVQSRSLNDYVSAVLNAAIGPALADSEFAGLRQRLAQADLLSSGRALTTAAHRVPPLRLPDDTPAKGHRSSSWSPTTVIDILPALSGRGGWGRAPSCCGTWAGSCSRSRWSRWPPIRASAPAPAAGRRGCLRGVSGPGPVPGVRAGGVRALRRLGRACPRPPATRSSAGRPASGRPGVLTEPVRR
jgi:hypothetical protein